MMYHIKPLRQLTFWHLVCSLALLSLFLAYRPAQAAPNGVTFTVDSFTDGIDANPFDGVCRTRQGECTIRAAIQQTNRLAGADTIILPAGDYTLSIPPGNNGGAATGDLDITDDLTILGDSTTTTAVSANGLDRVLEIAAGSHVTIVDVVLEEGLTNDNGGGIYNQGDLSLISLTVGGNQAMDGGGIYNSGSLTLTEAVVSVNLAANNGGGIYNSGTLIMEDSNIGYNVVNCDHSTYVQYYCGDMSGDSGYVGGGGLYNSGIADISGGAWGYHIAFDDPGAAGSAIANVGQIAIQGASFEFNLIDEYGLGGVLYNGTAGTLTVQGSSFANNITGFGSSVLTNEGTATMSDCLIGFNTVLYSGDTAMGNYGNLTVQDTTVLTGSQFYGVKNHQGGVVAIDGGEWSLGIENWDTATVTAVTLTDTILHNYGDLTLSSSEMVGSYIVNEETMTMADTAVHDYICDTYGQCSSAVQNNGSLTIQTSSIFNNASLSGGGVVNGSYGSLTVQDSAIYNNAAMFQGGGIATFGPITITNSTISGNYADGDGGGLYLQSDPSYLENLTLTDNTADADQSGAGDGGGVYLSWNPNDPDDPPTSPVYIHNTILAGNADTGGEAPDCAAELNSQGYNLVQELAGCSGLAVSDVTGQVAGLQPLAQNGGSTPTHALYIFSPALDGGDPASCPANDQRGMPRPADGDNDSTAVCDIGAYEAQ